jgi:hypothetical protein
MNAFKTRKTQQLAETIRAKRQLEIQNGIFGINDLERLTAVFWPILSF